MYRDLPFFSTGSNGFGDLNGDTPFFTKSQSSVNPDTPIDPEEVIVVEYFDTTQNPDGTTTTEQKSKITAGSVDESGVVTFYTAVLDPQGIMII